MSTHPSFGCATGEILAWHFGPGDDRLANGDGRPIVVGETIRHEGPLTICKNGLHASVRLCDALRYARSWRLHRVRCGGEIVQGYDKLVCRERTVLWSVDARLPMLAWLAEMLEHRFTRERARGREPDRRSEAVAAALRADVAGEPVDWWAVQTSAAAAAVVGASGYAARAACEAARAAVSAGDAAAAAYAESDEEHAIEARLVELVEEFRATRKS